MTIRHATHKAGTTSPFSAQAPSRQLLQSDFPISGQRGGESLVRPAQRAEKIPVRTI